MIRVIGSMNRDTAQAAMTLATDLFKTLQDVPVGLTLSERLERHPDVLRQTLVERAVPPPHYAGGSLSAGLYLSMSSRASTRAPASWSRG